MSNAKQKHRIAMLAFFTALVAFKILTASVSLSEDIRSVVTADYWNFGKSLLHGKVLYRDIVDHKGAYLFWLYAILHKVSGGNIVILPFAEAALFAATCLSAASLCKAVLGEKKGTIAAMAFSSLYALLTMSTPLLNTEPMLLPILFLAYKTVALKKSMSIKGFFAWGLVFGAILNAKYAAITYVAPIAWFAILKLSFLSSSKEEKAKNAILSTIFSFLGIALVNVPFDILLLFTKTTGSFFAITKAASSCSTPLAILSMVVASILLAASTYRCVKEGDGLQYLSLSMASSLVLSLPMVTFKSYYFSPVLGMAFLLVLFGNTKHIARRVGFYIAFSLLAAYLLVAPELREIPTKEIANRLGTTNERTLYICEDLGLGAYNDEPFKEPLQWIPVKCLRSKKFSSFMEVLSIDRVVERRFQFVVAPAPKENDGDKDDLYLLWERVLPHMDGRYEEALVEEAFIVYKRVE